MDFEDNNTSVPCEGFDFDAVDSLLHSVLDDFPVDSFLDHFPEDSLLDSFLYGFQEIYAARWDTYSLAPVVMGDPYYMQAG